MGCVTLGLFPQAHPPLGLHLLVSEKGVTSLACFSEGTLFHRNRMRVTCLSVNFLIAMFKKVKKKTKVNSLIFQDS